MKSNRQHALNELWTWTLRPATHFTHRLYDLIAKADYVNRAKISKGYPDEVELFNEWQSGAEFGVFARHCSSLCNAHQVELSKILASRNLTRAYSSIDGEGEQR
jgi:hypothetical protein